MDGIIVVHKEKGFTSFDVVAKLRGILKQKKIGHTGTLDPDAEGVLVVCLGKATKLCEVLTDKDKSYEATLLLGKTTDTEDSSGKILTESEVHVTKEEVEAAIQSFIGEYDQIPPMYSALKVNGKKLCDIARKNPDKDIEIASREIEIYSIELIEFHNDFAKIKVFCKKGTYIRSLVNDIGQKLGCGAYMTDLIRTKAGNFMIEKADLLDSDNYSNLNPLDVLNLSKYELSNEEYGKIMNGNFIGNKGGFINSPILLTKDYKLVSVAILSDNLIKPKKTFKGE